LWLKTGMAGKPFQEMKHFRSSIEDLRRLFERSITVKDIAEPFESFDDGHSALQVRSFLESNDYDVVGVRRKGMIEGSAFRSELEEGKLGDFARTFEPETQLSDSAALLSVFELLLCYLPDTALSSSWLAQPGSTSQEHGIMF
jgi:hypothetical protein